MVLFKSLPLLLTLVSTIPPSGLGKTALLEFTADWCGPCRSMNPVVHRLVSLDHPIRRINVDRNPELAAKYAVSQLPCFVMLVGGREVDRVVGATTYERLVQMLTRPDEATPNRSMSPQEGLTKKSKKVFASSAIKVPTLPCPKAPPPHPNLVNPPAEHLLESTVRIVVEDAQGQSYGTGTIIDARGGEALVLTCGHIFRDSQGKGPIHVQLFGPGAEDLHRVVEGRLIGHDLKRDLGLLSFRTSWPVRIARVAPLTQNVRSGDRVVSVGCNEGRKPTLQRTYVTGIDRYDGPSNTVVSGTPVEGRSGGGLFNRQGHVVGVCFAADPQDNEGLYAGLPSIYAELERLGLAYVRAAKSSNPPIDPTLAQAKPPTMPEQMPLPAHSRPGTAAPASPQPSPASPLAKAENRTPENKSTTLHLKGSEQALLCELGKRSRSAEVICIIRPKDPQSKSEILVLDDASRDFLQRLTQIDQKRSGTKHLTSMDVARDEAPSLTVRAAKGQGHGVSWSQKD